MKLKRVTVKNTQDFDKVITDAFGVEHILFPKQEKTITVLETEDKRKDDRRHINYGSSK